MSNFKVLIDTNVFIGLEDAKHVASDFAELVRRCGKYGVRIFIHEASVRDIMRDRDAERRNISLSKIRKFEGLAGIKLPAWNQLEAEFGPVAHANDEVDVALLHALSIGAVDFLITQDQGVRARVKLSALSRRVLTVGEALAWLRQTFDPTEIRLPLVEERKAHEIDPQDQIFDDLRARYRNFDGWWRSKCVAEHRFCWTIAIDDELAGLVVRKEETHSDAGTKHPGPKILKICTFKVKEKFRGEKLGELLLKQVLWFAQRNGYNAAYLTTYQDQRFLIEVITYFGFEHTLTQSDGELVYEKSLSAELLTAGSRDGLFELDRRNYPRFVARAPARVFCVPIKGPYHQKLFPEIAVPTPLPLFPEDIRSALPARGPKLPGNTIRKVYLCRAKTTAIGPGDLLLFYHSKTAGLIASQSVTSVGVIENVACTRDLDELVRLTAKRSVFTESELKALVDKNEAPIKVIDFLLAGHLEPQIELAELVRTGVFLRRPPQSICLLERGRFEPIRRRMNFGFTV